jgi:aspartate aminotransferase
MADSVGVARDVNQWAADPGTGKVPRLSAMSSGLAFSDIFRVATEIRAMTAAGRPVADFTIGDFSPRQFAVPERLVLAIGKALADGETNYPPTNGLPELREGVRELYRRELGLDYPLDSVTIASGGRPLVYGAFRTICDPGDRVVYGVPSWNNHHYAHMVGAESVTLECRPEDRFLPTRQSLEAALPKARLVCLNTPLNPSGTAIAASTLRAICEAIVTENAGRERRGQRPLYLLYDQMYWMLTLAGTEHVTPPGLVPEMARYTVFVDGISKSFAGTGLRVGWGVGPTDVMVRMSAFLGHVGAWAPRPEQVGTIAFLGDLPALSAHRTAFTEKIGGRLRQLHAGFERLRAAGLPVESLPPMGAIYLAVRFDLIGRRTPKGEVLASNEDLRRYLLEAAAFGAVAFEAFGAKHLPGWFRLSIGAVGEREIEEALVRLEAAVRGLA